MGADMIMALVAHKRDAKPDFAAGKKFIETMDLSNENLLQTFVDEGLDENECFDDENKPIPKAIHRELATWVDEFEQTLDSRDVTYLTIRDLTCYIAGGMSWGDAPEGCSALWRISTVPGLLGAMGFEENWHEPDPTVSPDEEAAAIESIKKVGA